MDTDAILHGLEETDWQKRMEAIQRLRGTVRRSRGELDSFGNLKQLFDLVRSSLEDTRWNIALEMTGFVEDISSQVSPEVDLYMSEILPSLVQNLGDGHELFRKATGRALLQYATSSDNFDGTLMALKRHGMENSHPQVRIATSELLSSFVTSISPVSFVRKAIDALLSRLDDGSSNVVESAKKSLSNIKALRSDFQDIINSLPPLRKRKLSFNDKIQPKIEVSVHSSDDSTPSQEDKKFGFLTDELVEELSDVKKNWRVRAEAIEKLLGEMRSVSDFSVVIPHLEDFVHFISKLLDDPNFKISLTTFQICGIIVQKFSSKFEQFLCILLPVLVRKLGDNKIVVRQETMKIFVDIIRHLSPKKIVSLLLTDLRHSNSRVREGVVNVIIVSLLTHKKLDFDFPSIVAALLPVLSDKRAKVKFVTVEAIAVIHKTIGSDLDPLLTNLELHDSETYKLLKERFAQQVLPILSSDGTVAHQLVHDVCSHKGDVEGGRMEYVSGSVAEETKRRIQSAHRTSGRRGRLPWELQGRHPRISSAPWRMMDNRKSDGHGTFVKQYPLHSGPEKDISTSIDDSPDRMSPLSPNSAEKYAVPPSPFSGSPVHVVDERSDDDLLRPVPRSLSSVTNRPKVDSRREMKIGMWKRGGEFVSASSPVHPTLQVETKVEEKDSTDDFQLMSPSFVSSPTPHSHRRRLTSDVKADIPSSNVSAREIADQLKLLKRRRWGDGGDESEVPTISVNKYDDIPVKGSPTYMTSSYNDEEVDNPPPRQMTQPTRRKQSLGGYSRRRLKVETNRRPSTTNEAVSAKRIKGAVEMGSCAIEELTTSELKPLDNPSKSFDQAMSDFSSTNWYDQYESVNIIRRLSVYHSSVLMKNLHEVVLAVLKLVDSLRSLIAKNSIQCCADMFSFLKRNMDGEANYAARELLKRTGESNKFIAAQAEKALEAMVLNITDNKAIAALLINATHRSATVRSRTAYFIGLVIQNMSPEKIVYCTHIDKIFSVIVQFLGEGSMETRSEANRITFNMYKIVGDQDFDLLCRRYLSDTEWSKFRNAVERGRNGNLPTSRYSRKTKSLGGGANTSRAISSRRTSVASSRSHSVVGSSSDPDSSGLSSILKQLESREWRLRQVGLTRLREFVIEKPRDVSGHALALLDSFIPRLADVNLKINVLALETLKHVLPTLSHSIEPVLPRIVPQVLHGCVSSNPGVRRAGQSALDCLASCIDGDVLVQHLSKIAIQGNINARAASLEKIGDILVEIYQKKPHYIERYVLPVCLANADEMKGDVRTANENVVRKMYSLMGSSLFEGANVSSEQAMKLYEMV